ncbi:hypothetical protein M2139_002243 [Enterococcus sp. PF1-24]|uniref:hypothetical protein n=1 Tax=unclassified Enterococcus TaxID=2608891 RepID=UPI0024770C07|nr:MULTISPECIES: hypothetical protein [unclassified Enterococcus]MDH6365241.1 hypothetical protein [Enterococcus sp. PFB1-1]MDH6402342.1 hypothetical protein [Enterococcus sp. PF1-24]
MLEKQQAKKIVDELLNYFLYHEISEIKIALDFAPEGLYIEIQGKTPQQPDDLQDFVVGLNAPRDINMEEYCEHLIGSDHHDIEDYHLLGVLIDDSEILYDAPIFDVKIFRKK